MSDVYAVVAHGGSQHKMQVGQELLLDNMPNEAGDAVEFGDVLLISDGERSQVGQPHVAGVSVKAEVVGHELGDKVEILKFKRRKHHMKRQGHRQQYTRVVIKAIDGAFA